MRTKSDFTTRNKKINRFFRPGNKEYRFAIFCAAFSYDTKKTAAIATVLRSLLFCSLYGSFCYCFCYGFFILEIIFTVILELIV